MSRGLRTGLDIGATKTLGVVIDQAGAVVARAQEPTEAGADGIVRTTARVVDQLRAQLADPLDGPIGLGVPGLVDSRAGTMKHAVNLGVDGGWLPLSSLVSERIGTDVVIENDVNAAALGAVAVSGADDLVHLSIGTGLAAGVVLEGRLRRGAHGAAGEIGHVPVDPEGLPCSCGQRGCLETIASGSALASAWPSEDVPAAQALFAAAAAGNARAVAVRARFAAGVAAAVRVMCLGVDPDVVMLGGGVAHVGEPLREAVADVLRDQARDSAFLASLDLAGRLRIVPADHPVAAIGAALLGDQAVSL